MSTFPFTRIGTPDGLLFEGEVRALSAEPSAVIWQFCRALQLLYCTWNGRGHVVLEDGNRRNAACIGGMLSMMNGDCRVLATTWEWKRILMQGGI